MRNSFPPALLLAALVLCALPLRAQPAARRVVAPCALSSASLGPSAEDSPEQGRGFAIHIVNGSAIPLRMPSIPEFGWRVETRGSSGWKLKAEGGPVRRVGSPDDPHMAIVGQTGSGAMVELLPTFARDFRFSLPGADKALRHEGKLTVLRLSVYWAPSAEMQQANPPAQACAITANWTVTIRP